MQSLVVDFTEEVELVKKIGIIPSILDVICLVTGMGFAAVARVTEDRWIACQVRDDIGFGLKPGGELEIKTTICNEIRNSGQGVVIDHVAEDSGFCEHHTPRHYGFQSYISMPIFLQSGEFFGTLCAIDPKPAQLKNPKIMGMFTLFAELISFHLQALDYVAVSSRQLQDSSRQLSISRDENRQYQYVSNHTLQEPLRKLQIYTNRLLEHKDLPASEEIREVTVKINRQAKDISMMIKGLTDFSELGHQYHPFETVDLNNVLQGVCSKLRLAIVSSKATIHYEVLHTIKAIGSQMAILFYHLLSNALKFSKRDTAPLIKIYSRDIPDDEVKLLSQLSPGNSYCEISCEDNGIGIDPTQREKIFDVFARLTPGDAIEGFGIGLAQCKRIVSNHGGMIMAHSVPGRGATFSVILPVDRR